MEVTFSSFMLVEYYVFVTTEPNQSILYSYKRLPS